MIFGCCIGIDHYDEVVKAGFETLTLSGVEISSYTEEQFDRAKEILQKGPLKRFSINSFCPGNLRFHGEGWDLEALRAYTEKLCLRGSALGFRYIGIGSPANKRLLEGEDKAKADEEMAQSMNLLCDVAAKYNMEILLESITKLDTNNLNSTKECYEFVKKLNRDNFHLVYDIYHENMEGFGPEVIASCIDEIKVVHLSALQPNNRAYLKQEEASLYHSYYEALKCAGYKGEFNLECQDPHPEQHLQESMAILKSFED